MTRFYEVRLLAAPRLQIDIVASSLCVKTSICCQRDAQVFVGVDLYDVSVDGIWTSHRLVVACLPAEGREPTSLGAIRKIITPMLLDVMRREVTPA